MKATQSLLAISALAALLLTGCNKNNNNYDSSATNTVTGGTGGMMNTNLPATNAPDINQNTPAPAVTNK
jgi:hypothetical protein